MPRLLVIAAIAASYFAFAILLNSVGTVILQSINTFDISKPEAATLEGYKDLTIAFVSFLVASFVPRLGYKVAMLAALLLVTAACLITPVVSEFVAIKALFACIGAGFALIKVSVYAMVGLLSSDTRSHSSLLNTIEGIFMVGVLSGYWIFSAFVDPLNPGSPVWMNVYYWLAALLAINVLLVCVAPVPSADEKVREQSAIAAFTGMLKLAYQPLVIIFVVSIFLYVLIEQGIGSWLPTFNNEVLHLPVDISVQITSLFALSIAVGRLAAGQVLRFINWFPFLLGCAVLMGGLIIITLPMAEGHQATGITQLSDAPLAAFILPMIGLLMAPLYPILNSVMLSALDSHKQAAMTGLIVVFSALGGTTGSVITGYLFEHMGGQHAFYMQLVPVVGIIAAIFLFRQVSQKDQTASAV
ncbi:MFS transporter [Alteromonas confluentis]|uniref:MFS transporter n=1 Tax=Alteromonas confluentis TaxID=1656094 RepID=A0A1E7ZEU6_9ALTE|nr:MFS transporter [Alteromonas confluentis]OFC71972.1 MFS transporter [Alteromonas confluentis]